MSYSMLIIAVILVVSFVVARRPSRTLPPTSSRTSPRRRKILRIVFVSVGALLLLLVSYGTWRDIHAPYPSQSGPVPTIHVPTLSLEEIISANPQWDEEDTRRSLVGARLLVQILLIDVSGPAPIVLDIDEYDMIWDPDDIQEIVKDVDQNGCKGRLVLSVTDVWSWGRPRYYARFSLNRDWESSRGGGSYGGGGGMLNSEPETTAVFREDRPGWLAISAQPGLQIENRLELVIYVRLAGSDDPLMSIPVTDLPEVSRDLSREALGLASLPPGLLLETDVSPAFRLLGRMELSPLLLLGAALGLARLAKRYSVGVMIAVPAAVLLVVLADWSAVSMHAAHLADRDATMETRYSAASRLAETFFFRRTASEAMTQVADNPAQPEPLRNITRLLSRGLDAATVPLRQYVSTSKLVPLTVVDADGRNLAAAAAVFSDDLGNKWQHPMLMIVAVDEASVTITLSHAIIALSQVDCYERIIMMDDQLRPHVIGTADDFAAAIDATNSRGLVESDVWKNVIMPALMPPPSDEAGRPAE